MLKISIPALSKIESGITDVNLSRLEQIADLFGLTVVNLLSFGTEEIAVEDSIEINSLQARLTERENDILKLQKMIIELYEELRSSPKEPLLSLPLDETT